jgi:hypothetical protein
MCGAAIVAKGRELRIQFRRVAIDGAAKAIALAATCEIFVEDV